MSWQSVLIAQWENECNSQSVLSMARAMIAQWENECTSLSVIPVARVQFPATVGYSRDFSLADRILPTRPEPVWQKIAQSPLNDTTTPHRHRTTYGHWGGRLKSNHGQTNRQTMGGKKCPDTKLNFLASLSFFKPTANHRPIIDRSRPIPTEPTVSWTDPDRRRGRSGADQCCQLLSHYPTAWPTPLYPKGSLDSCTRCIYTVLTFVRDHQGSYASYWEWNGCICQSHNYLPAAAVLCNRNSFASITSAYPRLHARTAIQKLALATESLIQGFSRARH